MCDFEHLAEHRRKALLVAIEDIRYVLTTEDKREDMTSRLVMTLGTLTEALDDDQTAREREQGKVPMYRLESVVRDRMSDWNFQFQRRTLLCPACKGSMADVTIGKLKACLVAACVPPVALVVCPHCGDTVAVTLAVTVVCKHSVVVEDAG